jgi:hypothetical protein
MTKEIPMANPKLSGRMADDLSFGFRHSLVITASSLVIFHRRMFNDEIMLY